MMVMDCAWASEERIRLRMDGCYRGHWPARLVRPTTLPSGSLRTTPPEPSARCALPDRQERMAVLLSKSQALPSFCDARC
jgi:hypothetical protein